MRKFHFIFTLIFLFSNMSVYSEINPNVNYYGDYYKNTKKEYLSPEVNIISDPAYVNDLDREVSTILNQVKITEIGTGENSKFEIYFPLWETLDGSSPKFDKGDIKKTFYDNLLISTSPFSTKTLDKYIYGKIFSDTKYEDLKLTWNEARFNDAMNTRVLIDTNFFKQIPNLTNIVKNDPEISTLYNKTPKDQNDVQKLNRLLLEQAYPTEIAKNIPKLISDKHYMNFLLNGGILDGIIIDPTVVINISLKELFDNNGKFTISSKSLQKLDAEHTVSGSMMMMAISKEDPKARVPDETEVGDALYTMFRINNENFEPSDILDYKLNVKKNIVNQYVISNASDTQIPGLEEYASDEGFYLDYSEKTVAPTPKVTIPRTTLAPFKDTAPPNPAFGNPGDYRSDNGVFTDGVTITKPNGVYGGNINPNLPNKGGGSGSVSGGFIVGGIAAGALASFFVLYLINGATSRR